MVVLAFTLANLARFADRTSIGTMVDVVALLGLAVYIIVALQRVYAESWARTVLETVLLWVVYLSVFSAGVAVLVLYGLLTC